MIALTILACLILAIPVFILMFILVKSKLKPVLISENFKTMWHKVQVFRFMWRTMMKLFKRAIVHDLSKFGPEEAPYFAKAKGLNTLEYGSPEYKKMLKETLKPALDHHYANNSHHPEYHEKGFHDMSLLDQLEMLCDWKAATLRTKDGDIKKSLEFNQGRFGYNEDTKKKFIEFLKDINAY
jgi:hypothetical protein